MKRTAVVILGIFLTFISITSFASVFGTVKAIVHDPQHRPVQGAQVEVQSRTSAFKTSGTTDEGGIATVLNVPVGEYDVTVTSQGFAVGQQSATVMSGSVQELHF